MHYETVLENSGKLYIYQINDRSFGVFSLQIDQSRDFNMASHFISSRLRGSLTTTTTTTLMVMKSCVEMNSQIINQWYFKYFFVSLVYTLVTQRLCNLIIYIGQRLGVPCSPAVTQITGRTKHAEYRISGYVVHARARAAVRTLSRMLRTN